MITLLLIAMVILDVALLFAVFYINRKQDAQIEVVEQLSEERQMLSELRSSVHEELEAAQAKAREILNKATALLAEAEQEVKAGSSTISKDVETIANQLAGKFEEPLKELSRRQAYVEALVKRIDREKATLQKLLDRGENICRFFDNKVPYEEVLREIEDKKYSDARSMLARGKSTRDIASELGMSESEVRLVAGLSIR